MPFRVAKVFGMNVVIPWYRDHEQEKTPGPSTQLGLNYIALQYSLADVDESSMVFENSGIDDLQLLIHNFMSTRRIAKC